MGGRLHAGLRAGAPAGEREGEGGRPWVCPGVVEGEGGLCEGEGALSMGEGAGGARPEVGELRAVGLLRLRLLLLGRLFWAVPAGQRRAGQGQG